MTEFDSPSNKDAVKSLANIISRQHDCDILTFNYGIEPGFDFIFLKFLRGRSAASKNLMLFLTTEGGDADAAYRIARYLQGIYCHGKITIIVAGWCKSAGTLICAAANELIICDAGELGPLDVQIAKADELGEHSSGLAVEASFEKLHEESFKSFMRYLTDIKDETGARITFKTAADMSANMVVGMMSGIFSKIDPLAVGEDYRSTLIAEEYALRLNIQGRNLATDRLRMLVRGYPSHRFVIDRTEAANLFRNVSPPSGEIAQLADLLESQLIFPRNQRRNQAPLLEFINDEPAKLSAAENYSATEPVPVTRVRRKSSGKANGAATSHIPSVVSTGTKQKSRRQPSA